MFGANYYGSVYYGEAGAQTFVLNLRTLTATVTSTARLSKTILLTRKATVTALVSFIIDVRRILPRLALAVTRTLNFSRSTRALNSSRSTRRII